MFAKARKSVYQEDDTDAAEWYSAYLSPFLGVCLKITSKDVNNAEVVIYQGTWESTFKTHVEAVVNEIIDGMFATDGQWKHGLLDSILVKIDLNGTESTGNRNEYNMTTLMPIYALQNKLQVECIKEAVKTDYDPLTQKKACTAQNNIITFKLNEKFA